jgi:sec-independent protein translocase protein TatB
MLDIGWTELLVIGIVLIVVVGPKDLPPMLRAFGRMTGNLRKMAGEFRTQFDDALRETEMDEVRKTIADAQKLNPSNALRDAINPLRQMGQEIRGDLEKSTRTDKAREGEKPDVEAQKAVEGVIPAEQPEPVTIPAPAMSLPATPPTVSGPAKPARNGSKSKPAAEESAVAVPKPRKTRASSAKVEEAVAATAAPRKRATKKKAESPKDDA